MNLLLPAVVANIPVLAIAFVTFLLFFKLYAKIRSKFKVSVNCWFCNRDTKVAYDLRNNWVCPSCEQYNGFTRDGDYNRDVPGQQGECSGGLRFATAKGTDENISRGNGLCETCNEHQRIKVEKLAQFEPRSERSFEGEYKKYKASLEEKYRLCVSCERHVSKVLRDKKKMILGSKLAAFVFQKINVLKVPDVRMVKYSRGSHLKQLSTLCLLTLGLVNCFITFRDLNLKRDQLGSDPLSQAGFVILSHLVALARVIFGYVQQMSAVELVEKSYLFARTLVALCCYTMGFHLGKPIPYPIFVMSSWSLSYGSIFLAFINNILDGFKLGKSALLLTVWSIFAGVTNSSSSNQIYGVEIVKVLTSIATVILAFPSFKTSDKILLNSTASSFHRIYSEDYLSDNTKDTESTLNSTMLNNSSKSHSLNSSANSVRSFYGKSIAPRVLSPNKHNPDFSSSFSLNSPAPTASFKQYISEEPTIQNTSNNSLNSSFLNSTMQSCNEWGHPFSTASNASFMTCAPLNQTLSADISIHRINNSYSMPNSFIHSPIKSFPSYPPNSPVVFSSNNSVCRRNLVSPSRLGAQAFVVQPSWVSGGYFNSQNKFGQKNYFLETASPKDPGSRASSQSSGFESQGSTQSMQNAEQIFSRENSYCPDEHYTSQYDPSFDRLNGRGLLENPIGLLPQLQSEKSFNAHLGYPQQPSPLAASPLPSCHSFGTNCFSNGSIFNSSIRTVRNTASPFDDLNKMGEDLPCIQKGSLLKKWKEKNLIL